MPQTMHSMPITHQGGGKSTLRQYARSLQASVANATDVASFIVNGGDPDKGHGMLITVVSQLAAMADLLAENCAVEPSFRGDGCIMRDDLPGCRNVACIRPDCGGECDAR